MITLFRNSVRVISHDNSTFYLQTNWIIFFSYKLIQGPKGGAASGNKILRGHRKNIYRDSWISETVGRTKECKPFLSIKVAQKKFRRKRECNDWCAGGKIIISILQSLEKWSSWRFWRWSATNSAWSFKEYGTWHFFSKFEYESCMCMMGSNTFEIWIF